MLPPAILIMAKKIGIGIAIGIEIDPNKVIAAKIPTLDSDPDSDKDSDSIKMRIAARLMTTKLILVTAS